MKMNKKEFYKYYKDYIEGVDLTNIEFKHFNYQELLEFLNQNYYDKDFQKSVYWEPDGFMSPFGMYYLDFITCTEDTSYLMGITNNSKGGKTIAFCMIYDASFGPIDEENNKVGYINTIETNYFFRKKGILNRALEHIKNTFKDYEVLVFSPESITGNKISITKKISEIFDKNITIMTEDEYFQSLSKRNKW